MSEFNVIEVENLVKKFGNFVANDHLSFSVKKGEIFGFLGANGAGKTTAMRILCGLLNPTSGRIIVAGCDAHTDSEKIKKHIGYMSQKFSLYEDLTVYENMKLYGGIYGMTKENIKIRIKEVLNRLNMENVKNTLIAQIPLGWKQKLAFSVAIFHKPEIVFLDEPTGGVDPLIRRQFWDLIYEAAHNGITVFVTTHYMDEAEYCDRISIMDAGRIVAMGTPSELKKRYEVETVNDLFVKIARPELVESRGEQ